MSPQDKSHDDFVPPTNGLNEKNMDQLAQDLQQVTQAHGRVQDLLNAVLLISSELDLNLVLHKITDTARRLVDARYGALGVLGPDGEFTDLITSGAGADLTARLGGTLPHGTGLLGTLVRDPGRCASRTWRTTPRPPASPRATRGCVPCWGCPSGSATRSTGTFT